MNIRILHVFALGMLAFSFLVIGCGNQQASDVGNDTHAESGYEGDNHPPGQHDRGTAESTDPDGGLDWCDEHAVPESECTKCNPLLIATFKESGDWCAGHGLPESHCRLCNPEIVFPQEEILRTRSLELSENEIEIALNFRPNQEVCASDGAIIQFASSLTADRTGISVQAVHAAHREATVDAPAEVVFDETLATVVTSTVPTLVSRWLVSPGDQVSEGDVLALLKSPEMAELKASLIATHASYEVEHKELKRHEEMRALELISEEEFDRQKALTAQARASHANARGLLLSAGLNEGDLEDILKTGEVSNEYALRSPAAGVVVERTARLGQFQTAGEAFATIAEPKAMWIEARLTEQQLKWVEVGHHLTFSSDGRGIDRVGGEIIWVSRFLDPHTRTGTVRARVIDPNHELHAGEFGRARIAHSENQEVVLVPRDAVQWEGCCNVVFIKERPDRYRPRKVQLLDSDGPFYQVAEGVRAGESVVVNGAFLLKTELKKTSIGAGCCGLDPVG